MAATAQLKGRVELDTGPFRRGLASLKMEAARFGKAVGPSFQDAANRLKSAAATVVAAASALAGIGIARNFQIEQLTLQFETLLGSVDAAKERMAELSKFAASTPFALDEVAKANKLLQSAGQGGMDMLRSIGDAAAATGVPFTELAAIMQKAFAMQKGGVALGDVINQLNERALLSADAFAKLRAESAKGVSTPETMKIIMAELARFDGAMKKLSESGVGRLSTLKDVSLDALGQITDGMADAASGGIQMLIDKINELSESGAFRDWGFQITATITGLINAWRSLSDEQRDSMLSMAKVSAGFIAAWKLGLVQPLIATIGYLVSRFVAMLNPTVLLAGLVAIPTFVAGLALGRTIEKQLQLSTLLLKVREWGLAMVEAFASFTGGVLSNVLIFGRAFGKAMTGDFKGVAAELKKLKDVADGVGEDFDKIGARLQKGLDKIDEVSEKPQKFDKGAFVEQFETEFGMIIFKAEEFAKDLWERMQNGLQLPQMGDALGTFIENFQRERQKALAELRAGANENPLGGLKKGVDEAIQAMEKLKGKFFRGGKITDIRVGAQDGGGGKRFGGPAGLLQEFRGGLRNGAPIAGALPAPGARANAIRLRQEFDRETAKKSVKAQESALDELKKLNARGIILGDFT